MRATVNATVSVSNEGGPTKILSIRQPWLRVKVNGVDMFKPQTGEVISDNADGVASCFINIDYNKERLFGKSRARDVLS